MRFTPIATLLSAALLSLPVHALDLLQAYQEALANDTIYTSARHALAAGEERLPQAKAGLLPSIGIGGSVNRLIGDVETLGMTSDRRSTTHGYSLTLTQPLFRMANWETYEQGKLSVAISQTQFEQAHQDLIVRVAQAYFEVLTAQDALASLQAEKTAITEQLAFAKRNFEVGTATITDTHEAQARYDLTVARELAAINELEIRRAALQQIIGRAPGELSTLRPGVGLSGPQPMRIDDWVDSAQSSNYSVISQQLALEIAQREIRRNRAAHYPTLDLVASRNYNNQDGSNLTTTNSVKATSNNIGVQWNIPLYSGFAATSRVREAVALQEKARADLETARRQAAQEARQSFLSVNSGLAQVRALQAAEVSSQSALESNRLGYQVGVRINIDVLNAQQQLYSTQRDLARARYETLVNSLRLKAATGALQEQDLVQIDDLLEP